MINKLPTIDIKGKKYVQVKDRISFFNKNYPKGDIHTRILTELDSEKIIIRAVIYPDTDNSSRYFTGHSQATVGQGMVNQTAALENAETSAVGRALAMMGIGVIEGIASAEEINKAKSGESSKTVGKRLTNEEGCDKCHAPAGKPHASSCPTIT